MAGTRWHDVSAAILTAYRATTGYCAPTAYATGLIPVYDGAEVFLTEPGAVPRYVVVRWGGQLEAPSDPGRSGQSFATVGRVARAEVGEVRCRAVAQTGDVDVAGAAAQSWADAFTLVKTIEDAMRTDVTLGIVAPNVVLQLASVTPSQRIAGGFVTELDFVVGYEIRI